MGHTTVEQLVEVVGKNLRRETYGNTLHTLCKQQREFYGQRDGLFVATIVGEHPLGNLGAEDHLECKLRESRLDITGSSRTVAGEDVTPVTLRVNQQIFLSELHECVTDGGIAVGVELHSVSHDVGHLYAAAVIHTPHRVEDTPLHRLESIVYVGHRSLQNHIGGVVEEPIAEESRKFCAGLAVLTHQLGVLIGEFAGIHVGDLVGLLLLAGHLDRLYALYLFGLVVCILCHIVVLTHSHWLWKCGGVAGGWRALSYPASYRSSST